MKAVLITVLLAVLALGGFSLADYPSDPPSPDPQIQCLYQWDACKEWCVDTYTGQYLLWCTDACDNAFEECYL